MKVVKILFYFNGLFLVLNGSLYYYFAGCWNFFSYVNKSQAYFIQGYGSLFAITLAGILVWAHHMPVPGFKPS